jgi:Icc-related predicted phosphoesterase
MISQESGIDAIITKGDLVGHSIAGDSKDESKGDKNMLKSIITEIADLMKEQFPDIPVLPAIGNNDYWFHD